MVSRKILRVWKELLAHKIPSFTTDGVKYCVFIGENGWECECLDFKIRGGSYDIFFQDPSKSEGIGKPMEQIQGCKHIAQELANIGMKDVTKVDGYGHKEKVKANVS